MGALYPTLPMTTILWKGNHVFLVDNDGDGEGGSTDDIYDDANPAADENTAAAPNDINLQGFQ